MRRLSIALSLLVIALLGMVSTAQRALAQDDAASDVHPIVGTWIVSDDSGAEDNTPSIVVFSSDGTVVDLEVGFTAAGVWEATGDNTADATFAGFVQFEGIEGSIVIRISAEIDDDDTISAEYSVTGVAADGTVFFSETGSVSGVRMEVEPVENGGQPLNGLPTWVVSTGEDDDDAVEDDTGTPTTDADDDGSGDSDDDGGNQTDDDDSDDDDDDATPVAST